MDAVPSLPGPLSVALTAAAAYVALIAILRVSGKRTLTDMNAFDFIVTVALGSILASTIVSDSVSLADGLVALVTLVALQALIALIASRSKAFRGLVKSEPRLLLFKGRLLVDAIADERLSEAEVMAAARAAGAADLSDLHAVVLETNGELSVVRGPAPTSQKAMLTVSARAAGEMNPT